MSAVFVSNGLAFGAWAGNIPRLREAAGLTDASLGVLLLCVSLGALAAMQVAGRYGAVVGTARGSWLSALVLACVLPAPALVSGYGALLAAGAALGFGLGLLDVCMNAHAAWMERRWGAAIMSSFHAGWSVGQLVGAALAGVLVGVGFATSFAVAAVAVAALGLAALLLPEEHGRVRETVPFAWPTRRIVLVGVLVALSFSIEGGTSDWSGVYLRGVLGAPASFASAGLVLFAGTMVVMRLTGDWVVRRLGAVAVLTGGAVLAGAGVLAAVAAPVWWAAAAGFALVGVGVANVVPILFTAAGREGRGGGVAGGDVRVWGGDGGAAGDRVRGAGVRVAGGAAAAGVRGGGDGGDGAAGGRAGAKCWRVAGSLAVRRGRRWAFRCRSRGC